MDIEASARRWALAGQVAVEADDAIGQAFAEAGEGLAALASGAVMKARTHFVRVIDAVRSDDPQADWIIGLGPGAGHDGGRIVFEGTPADLVAKRSTLTAAGRPRRPASSELASR